MKRVILLSILFSFLCFVESNAQTSYFSVNIDGAQANAGAGTGSAGEGTGYAYYDESTMSLTVSGSFSGLTGNTTVAHVHIGAAGSNGGVVFGLTLSPSGSTDGYFSGSGTLDASQESALLADGLYVNIHSSFVPAGEIRGQINLQAEPNSTFSIAIDGSQADAGNGTGSAGNGSGTGIYNPNTMELTVSGDFSGLTGTTTVAHVHIGAAGSNGGVVFGLTLAPQGGTSGNFYGTGVLDSAQSSALLADGLYINIHSSFVPAGEIRGQILLNPEPMSSYSIEIDGDQANAGAGTGSAGIGTGTATYNPNTMMLNVTGNYSGLTGNTTVAHVHIGAAGFNGGVVFGLTLNPSGSISGTFSGSGMLSDAQESALLTNGLYVNIHSSFVPAGEIRGQIIMDLPTTPEGDSCLINWTNLTNASIFQGNRRVRKISGSPGYNSGGLSQNFLGKNDDGWIQMEALRTDKRVLFGLTLNNMIADEFSIRFGIEIRGNGIALVREGGYVEHVIGNYNVGDIFRIEKENGVIKYYHNDIVVFTSNRDTNRKLYADVSLFNLNATLFKAYSSFSCSSPGSAKVVEEPNTYQVNSNVKLDDLVVFPNPFENQITVSYIDSIDEIKSIEMYNVSGQHIRSIEISQDGQTTINTDDLSRGFYIISINRTKHIKVVKQ